MKISFWLLLIFITFKCQSQEITLYPFKKGDKWGYRDANEKVIIDPIYDSVSHNSKSRFGKSYIVYDGKKPFVINKFKKTLIPIGYDNFAFSENYYPFQNSKLQFLFALKKDLTTIYNYEGQILLDSIKGIRPIDIPNNENFKNKLSIFYADNTTRIGIYDSKSESIKLLTDPGYGIVLDKKNILGKESMVFLKNKTIYVYDGTNFFAYYGELGSGSGSYNEKDNKRLQKKP